MMNLAALIFPALALAANLFSGAPGVLLIVAGSEVPVTAAQRERLRTAGWIVVQTNSPGVMTPVVYVIDGQRTVRRAVEIQDASGLLEAAEVYEAGRAAYRSACARCHGADGRSDSYPYIKTLNGLGARAGTAEIRARLHPLPLGDNQLSVRGHLFTARELDALVVYIAGL